MSNDWREHNGGPQPVADDVFVEVFATVDYTVNLDDGLQLSQFAPWARKLEYRILNQHLIDAALKRGIELGLDAAATKLAEWQDRDLSDILHIDPETIARNVQTISHRAE